LLVAISNSQLSWRHLEFNEKDRCIRKSHWSFVHGRIPDKGTPSDECSIKILRLSRALVAHTCNPSYSGGRNQEDQGSKPAGANSVRDPFLKKNTLQKRASGVSQMIGAPA
jgi:hypothetical protein